ncbi:hypothetical protein QCA50_012275 [Cerrena zonata]|uniref:malate synthase n=1 Tax=Cerrena zonata TaxID=2478898 RepID=A0AAW0FZE0_9APHY
MGGMAAQIPIKNDPERNQIAMNKVESDKLREATMNYDGTWVAHPALAPIANDVFNKHMITPNQIHIIPPENVSESDLSNTLIEGESWIRGLGCVPINYLMEDAATAEVSRLQLYSWVKHGVKLADTNEKVTPDFVENILKEETAKLVKESQSKGTENKFEIAANYLKPEIRGETLAEFLTTLIYDEIVTASSPIDLTTLKD